METINQFIIVITILFSICAAVHFWLLWARTRAQLNILSDFVKTLSLEVENKGATIAKLNTDREDMIKHLQMLLTKADATDEEKIAELKKWHAHLSYKKIGSTLENLRALNQYMSHGSVALQQLQNIRNDKNYYGPPSALGSDLPGFYGPENPLGPKI